jgi:CRISPR/Cas system-associated endoribonuclease Cas2
MIRLLQRDFLPGMVEKSRNMGLRLQANTVKIIALSGVNIIIYAIFFKYIDNTRKMTKSEPDKQ